MVKRTMPIGFKANAVASGIKKSGKLDLALIFSDLPAKAACVFTTNTIKASPVILDKDYLKKSDFCQAIIANSGNANCFNAKAGLRDALETSKEIANILGLEKENVLVASTGIIGKKLPVEKIKSAIPELAEGLSGEGLDKAKRAIMTTDTFPKECSVKLKIGAKKVTICGIAKGAGMIAPNMATLLCFIMTDANISKEALNQALKEAVNNSFNCITVDGCMSTNDTVMLLANGAAANTLIKGGRDLDLFREGLAKVCLELAKMIVRDAEGASKFIRIRVEGAKSVDAAKKVALSIANSNLFKTAVYGKIRISEGSPQRRGLAV